MFGPSVIIECQELMTRSSCKISKEPFIKKMSISQKQKTVLFIRYFRLQNMFESNINREYKESDFSLHIKGLEVQDVTFSQMGIMDKSVKTPNKRR